MLLWYNKDLFDGAGLAYPDETWDHEAYPETARRLTDRAAGSPTWGLYYPAFALDRFWYNLQAWGGRLVDPANPTRAACGAPKVLAAAEWGRELTFDAGANADRDLLFPSGGGGVAATIDRFAAGRLAMVEDGLYPFALAEGVGDHFAWGLVAVPSGPAGRRVLATADGFAIWAGSPETELAWELVKFPSGPEYQLELTKLTGYLPNRFSLLQQWRQVCVDAYPTLADVNLDVAMQAMEAGYPGNRPLFAKDAEAQALIAPALDRVLVSGDAALAHLVEVAEQVTALMRG